jgi:LysR family transcriptional regulator, positive regulator for ilvC
MDTASLRVFLSLASSLHFGRSSQECNLSPSAVSRTIGRLEEELGRKLFIRDNRSVELSPEGLEFRRYAQQALDDWERLRASMASGQEGLSGEIGIYSSVAASYTVLAGLLSRFRQRHPGIHIRLQTGDPADAIERVREGDADIAVAAMPQSLPRSLVFKAVTFTPLLFIAPTVDCEARSLTLKPPYRWSKIPLVLSVSGLSRKRADAWFRAAGIKPNIYSEVSGHEAILSMVHLGFGVGVTPKIVVDRFSLPGELRVLEVEPQLEPYCLGLCAHSRRLDSPAVRAFWEISEGL